MNIRISVFEAISAILIALLAVTPADAADKTAQDQAKRLQQQLRTAEREKSQLNAKNAEIEVRLKALEETLVTARRRGDVAGRRSTLLKRDLETLASEKEALKAKVAETEQMLAGEQRRRTETESRLAETVRQREEQRRAFTEEKLRLETELSASRERNERMYKLGNELINRNERIAISQSEPIIGIGRAQIEKMAEQERDKLDKDRLPLPPEVKVQSNTLPSAPLPERGAVGVGRKSAN